MNKNSNPRNKIIFRLSVVLLRLEEGYDRIDKQKGAFLHPNSWRVYQGYIRPSKVRNSLFFLLKKSTTNNCLWKLDGYGHITWNTPVLVRSPKLKQSRT